MRPNLHPRLVNGRFGDPALFVEMLHRRNALLFDAGDLSALSTRDLLRVANLFVSHMHMDHFVGFDALLRVNVGREKSIRVIGPQGIIEAVGHKLSAYDWDLVDRYETDLVFEVIALGEATGASPNAAPLMSQAQQCSAARFRFKRRFERELITVPQDLNRAADLRLEAALLEHHGPCLAFAVSEPAHVNVWKNRLDEQGLAAGEWLQRLKTAVLAGAADDDPIEIATGELRPLGELRALVTVTRGQKIAYVTDVADTFANRSAIIALAREADLLFIEARFAAADAQEAQRRAHLTTRAAGEIACEAHVRRVEPFHFSARYEDDEQRMLQEVFGIFDAQPRAPLAPLMAR